MVDTKLLKSIIVLNGKTQFDVAAYLGISPKTFYLRMKKGIFGSDEIEKMIQYLNIDDPIRVFFTTCVAREVTGGQA